MIAAYAYLRVSSKGQTEGDGFPRQREAISAYATGKDIDVLNYYEEQLTGGTDWDERPAWLDMLTQAATDGVTTIIIERLDRLARTLMVQEHIIADLATRGITLISTHEPDLDSADPTRVLMRQIMGAIAQYDRAMVVLKLRGARARMRKNTGACEGRKPFGHKPGEADTLAVILGHARAGADCRVIAGTLNTLGLATRRGGQWREQTVSKILRANGLARGKKWPKKVRPVEEPVRQ